mgnify:FL=1
MIEIVDTHLEHIDDIAELEKQCFSIPWTSEQLASQLTDNMHICLAAVDGEGRTVGYVGLMYVLDEGYISNVAVAPAHRREGIGGMLLDTLRERAEEKGLAFLTLEVRQTNEPAKNLYKKHGYVEVGLRKGYYAKPTEDAILMTLFLSEEEK